MLYTIKDLLFLILKSGIIGALILNVLMCAVFKESQLNTIHCAIVARIAQLVDFERIKKKVYFTSDLHLFHNRKFIYEPRGFSSEQEMREIILSEWKSKVKPEDDIYVLGDFCLGKDYKAIEELIESLPGKIHLVIGNHDTDAKVELYKTIPNIVEIAFAIRRKFGNRIFT